MKYIAITTEEHDYPGRVIFSSLSRSRETSINLACMNKYKPHEVMVVDSGIVGMKTRSWNGKK